MIIFALKRFLIIVAAYGLTVFVAALGGSLAILAASLSSSEAGAFFGVLGLAGMIIGIFATIPSFIMIMIAEYFGIRSVWYYAAIAVFAGIALARVFTNDIWMMLVGALLGVVCGATYWTIAGRKAGSLNSLETARAQTQLLLLSGAAIVAMGALMLMFMR
jgi:hypothetical protein